MNKDWSKFNKLNKRRDDIYHMFAKKAGITDTKFWVLYAICEGGGSISQNGFCENWCYSKQTVNAAVASLEKEGIVYLEFAEGSKKQKDLMLTFSGREFCRKNIEPVMEAECRSVALLEEKERQQFLSTKEKLLLFLEEEISKIE